MSQRMTSCLAVLASLFVLGGPGPAAAAPEAAEPAVSRDVVIRDVSIRVRGQEPVHAYLVRPAGRLRPRSHAGVLFLHWLGQVHNDRTEYLADATRLAGRGVVSLLPQGYFPWVPDPDGTSADVARVRDQVRAMRRSLNRLAGVRAVDRERIAVVGHDYGAMYGALLADRDRRVSALVLQAPDATWGNWFATFWLGLEGAAREEYLALFAGLDPVEHTARLGAHVLFQWAGEDFFIPEEVRERFAAASPLAQVRLYPDADHQLTDQARADWEAFLAEQLDLP